MSQGFPYADRRSVRERVAILDHFVAWAFIVLGVDLIGCGPFGVQVGGLSIRYALWGIVALLSFGVEWKSRSERRQFCAFAVFMGLLVSVWGVIVPVARGVDLTSSLRECRPLLAFPVFIAAQAAARVFGARKLLRIFALMSIAPAVAISVAWSARVLLGDDSIALALKNWLQNSGEWKSGVFIGPMPSGEYRVMWIVVMFFPLAILASAGRRLWWLWSGIFLLASVASNTRAVFLTALLAIVASVALRFRFRLLTTISCILVVGASLVHFVPETRLIDFGDTLDSGDPRMEQARSLLLAWASTPLLGLGFGGEAEVVRSELAPFSYELTYLALFSKVGLIGSLILSCWALSQLQAVMRLPGCARAMALVAVVCFLAITSTNPYLLNLFGLWLLMGLLAILHGGLREAGYVPGHSATTSATGFPKLAAITRR